MRKICLQTNIFTNIVKIVLDIFHFPNIIDDYITFLIRDKFGLYVFVLANTPLDIFLKISHVDNDLYSASYNDTGILAS